MNHGAEDELSHRIEQIEKWQTRVNEAIYGNGELGISQKNNIMWRLHVWVLCSLSGGFGIAATIIIQKLMKAFP